MPGNRALYTYYRSSASYRVRIALNFKGLAVEQRFVNIAPGATEQLLPAYAALNPQKLVPLFVDGAFSVNQSLAILEYLEELQPEPALLPRDPQGRARVRALACMICCEVQPLQNTRVQRYLASELGCDTDVIRRWVRHWISDGFDALEASLAGDPARGEFCHGAEPTLADVCLVPQLYNARRAQCELARWPTLVRIADACSRRPAFRAAEPERQPDAVTG
jgi:maleylacetoacetate isomerase